MTRKETGIIMDILATAYPRFYAGPDAPDPEKAVALWAEMFSGDDVRLVAAAVKALIATDSKGFPPHIGAVKEKLRQLTTPEQMTPAEAWNLVLKAINRSGYHSQEEFDKLPPLIRRIVGSPSTIRDWGMMDANTVQSVVASNFQRSYQARARQDAEYQALPSDVKQMLSAVSERFALKEGDHG